MRIPTHNPFNHSIRNASFTLVELLMVVLVLGILATIGVGDYGTCRSTHR